MMTNTGFIPEMLVEDIRSKADIVEIISEYVSIKKAGRNFKGLCPFHPEKTPSFNVSPDKQFFHCFGCGEGGSVFHFLMKIETLTFPESVRLLASRYGVDIPRSTGENNYEKDEREILYKLNQTATDFFMSQLHHPVKGLSVRKYLENRGISLALAKRFSLGFAPDSWDACLTYLKNKGYTMAQLEKGGLIKSTEIRDNFFDKFRNRVMFPFHDTRGRVVGFGGRFLGKKESTPKYLNSPETSIFKKGKIFYGIQHTTKGIQKSGFAIIVEGYFDLLVAFQNGIENVIAGSGTALTEDQAILIKRYTENITMLYDSDAAGRAASEKGFEVLRKHLSHGLHIKMATLPHGEDPDSYLRKHGPEKFNRIIKTAKPFIESLIDSAVKELGTSGSAEMKTRYANDILSFIRKIPSNIEKNEYVNILSERLKISEKAVHSDLFRSMKNLSTRSVKQNKTPNREAARPSLSEQCERGIVQIMIQSPDYIKMVEEVISLNDFKNPDLCHIASILFEQHDIGNQITIDKLIELLPEGNQKSLVGAIAIEPVENENIECAIMDFSKGIKKEERKNKLRDILKKKSDAANMSNADEFNKLQEHYSALRRELN